MRRVAALVGKDAREHAWSGLVALTLLTAVQLARAGWSEQQGAASLFGDMVGVMDVTVPIAALLAGHHLIVGELQARTRELLGALPLPPWLLWAQKLGLGAALVLGLVAWHLAVALVLAGPVELLPWAWCARLAVRYAAYGLAWWATAALIALAGRYRAAAWILLALAAFAAIALFRVPGVGELVALVAAPVSRERWALPTEPLVAAAAWSAGCVGVAALVLAWRGGRLLDGLQAGRGTATFVVLPAALCVLTLLPDGDHHRAWADLPGERVRAASPALEPLAARVLAVLPELEARLGAPLPDVVLVEGVLADVDDIARVDTEEEGGAEVVVAVGEGAEAPITRVLRLTLEARFPAARLRADGWRVLGLPSAVAPPDERERLTTCARLVGPDSVADWPGLQARWGPDVAAALAGERLAPEPAAPLPFPPGEETYGESLLGPPAAPEDWAAWRPAGPPATVLPAVRWRRQGGRVALLADADADAELAALSDAKVEWGELRERQRWPSEIAREPLPASREVLLPASPTARLAVRLVVPRPLCDLPSPWTVLDP